MQLMHPFPALALTFSLLPCASVAQSAPTPGASSAAQETGTAPIPAAPMTTYRNDTLHLAYSYPATFTDASGVVSMALQIGRGQQDPRGKDLSTCVTFPFSAMDSRGGFAMVLIGRADAGCMKKTFTAAQLPEYTQTEVAELTAAGTHPEFGQPVAFTTAGHPAELLRGSFALPTGQRLQVLVACVLLKPDVACWQFLGSSGERLSVMSAFPVSFEAGPPTPLVPPSLVPKP